MAKLTRQKKEEIIKKYGKIPTKEELFQKIKRSQERLLVSLIRAWETAPDDPKIREEVLEAIEKAARLHEKIYKDVVKEEPPEIEESYKKLRKILDREARGETN